MKNSRIKSALILTVFLGVLVVLGFSAKPEKTEIETTQTECGTEEVYLTSGGCERYNDGYSDVYMTNYRVAFDDKWKSARIYVEQWHDGVCVTSIPWVLSEDVTQVNLNLRIPMNGYATEISSWTDADGGECRMNIDFPKEIEISDWHYESYDTDCELPLDADGSKVVAVLSFDVGKGMSEGLLEEPERIETENAYVIAIRITFAEGLTDEIFGQMQSGDRVDLSKVVSVADAQKRNAYIKALEQVIYQWVSPSGDEWGPYGSTEFAIYDIDMDGREELLIHHEADMASTALLIYDYNDERGELYQELLEFPSLTFYENDMIEAALSHNHGMAPGLSGIEFWPYSLYQYDPATDVYEYVLQVDAWERERGETSYTNDTFQTEADVDGNGVLYFIMTDGEHNYDEPTDDAEYLRWREDALGEPRELEIPFIELPLVLPEAAA